MAIGGFLPWYTDTSGKDHTFRLFTQGFELFAATPEDTSDLASGVVFTACFLFLNLMTLVAVAILVQMAAGAWRRPRLGTGSRCCSCCACSAPPSSPQSGLRARAPGSTR